MVYKGIYLPSLSGRLQDARLEAAYQKYAHRQRQKSLVLVNSADVLLKVVILLKVTCLLDHNESGEVYEDDSGDLLLDRTCYLVEPDEFVGLLAWLCAAVAVNVMLGLVTLWKCYANNFLHWGALATWVLLLVQGREQLKV